MKKVCVAITGLNLPGGISALNLNVVLAMQEIAQKQGAQVEVLSYLDAGQGKPKVLARQTKFRAFGGSRIKFSVALTRKLLKADLIFFDHVTLALPILPFQRITRARTVVFAHGSEAWRKVRKTSRMIFKRADLCLANSSFTLKKMFKHVGEFNGSACLLGLSPRFELNKKINSIPAQSLFLTSVEGKEREIRDKALLLVGRIMKDEPGKGWWSLLDILPSILNHHPDTQVVFPGPGDGRAELHKHVKNLGIEKKVFIPGFLSQEKIRALYQRCFAYVMPSKQEGFGLVYLEAMNYAKPCIGCWNDGAQDVILNDKTGYLVDKGSRKDLFDAVMILLDNPKKARKLGENGFRRLHSKFTASKFQNRLKQKIEKIV